MTENPGAGWHTDPSGKFQVRYHDGTSWTEHVSTDGKQSVSPMSGSARPSPPPAPAVPGLSSGVGPGKPPSADRLKDRPWWQWLAAGFVLLIIIAAIVPSSDKKKSSSSTASAAATSGTTAAKAPAKQAHPTRVSGDFDKTCGGLLQECNSDEAAKKMSVSDVWCEWEGSHVNVHAVVSNGMNANVEFRIVPRYSIVDGGTHGQASGSDRPITVPAKSHGVFKVSGGHPVGVPDGAPIASCKPKLQDASLSNSDNAAASGADTAPAAAPVAKAKPAACGTKATDSCTPHVGSNGHVRVDAIVYRLLGATTAKTIGDPNGFGEKADGQYVILKVRVLSLKTESATLTDVFKLDINGKTYDSSTDGTVAAMGNGEEPFFLKELGPDATATGTVVFDVPSSKIGKKMELRLNEIGFGSTHAFIKVPSFAR